MTFTEKLKEQTKSYEATIREVKELFSRADKAVKDRNYEEADRLILQAEKSLDMVGELAKAFETIYAKEFEVVEQSRKKNSE